MTYFKLIRLVGSYRNLIVVNLIFNVLTVLFSLVSLVMIVPFLQLIFDKMPMVTTPPDFAISATYFNQLFYYYLSQQIILHGKSAALSMFCFQVVGVFFLKNFFRYGANYVLAPVKNGVVRDLRASLYDKLLSLPIRFFQTNNKGDIITKMTSDLREIESGIMSTLETVVVAPLTIVVYLAYMFISSSLLTGFVLLMVVVMALFVGRIGKSLKKDTLEGQQILADVTSIIDETISGIKVILGFNAQDRFRELFHKKNRDYFSIFNKMYRKKDLSSPLTEFLSIIIVSFILWFGGSLALGVFQFGSGNQIAPETFIAFMVVFSQLIAPAKSFSNAYYDIQKGIAGYQRIMTILSTENTIQEEINANEIYSFEDKIEFKQVGFAYEKDKPILKGINLEIKKGKVIAIVGSSGAGKSTLVDLLPRFYDVTEGQILIDGRDIRSYQMKSLRQLIGIVTQESILFNQSIEQNIVIDSEQINEEKLKRVMEHARINEFIKEDRNKQTKAGERGSLFSGGEKQRITIGRALYKDPPILILDEATSALDTKNEQMVQEAIQKMMTGRTCVIIAHRLSTVQHADEIIVMDKGSIIERGTHASLMASETTYKKLVTLQQLQ